MAIKQKSLDDRTIVTEWMEDFNRYIGRKKRNVLLSADNAPSHPPDIRLKIFTLKFFPPNTMYRLQLVDQGTIPAVKKKS